MNRLAFLFVTFHSLFIAQCWAVMRCFEAPSIPNSRCYKDNMLLTEWQMMSVFEIGESVTYECLPGYELRGNAVVTCQSSGLWTSRPQCIPVQATTPQLLCRGMPQVSNGYCRGINANFGQGEQITCYCDPDYSVANSGGMTTCSNGNWINVPTCRRNPTCQIPNIQSGSCQSSSASRVAWWLLSRQGGSTVEIGQEITCTCDSGMIFQSRDTNMLTSVCTENGWAIQVPGCGQRPSQCSSSPYVPNGRCSGQPPFRLNDQVTCQCDVGFFPRNSFKSSCTGAETWSSTPLCELPTTQAPKYCSLLTISNGRCVNGNPDFASGESVQCQCDSGYSLDNNQRALCMDGKWQNVPNCVRDAPKCQIPSIANGNCEIAGSRSFWGRAATLEAEVGQMLLCQCQSGYFIDSNAQPVCQQNGRWSANPGCTRVVTTTSEPTCTNIPQISNGYCPSTGFDFRNNQQIECFCNAGYSLNNNGWAKCNNGRWINVPTCNEDRKTTTQAVARCQIPSIANGNCEIAGSRSFWGRAATLEAEVGQMLLCQCQSGYFIDSNAQPVCQQNGRWSANPGCTRVVTTTSEPTCTNIPQISNGYCPSTGFDFRNNQQIECFCNAGYSLNNNGWAKCNNGRWINVPTCNEDRKTTTPVIRTCPRPPQPEGTGCDNCARAFAFVTGDQVRYECRAGYTIVGNSIITCQSDGTWSNPPQCIPNGSGANALAGVNTCPEPNVQNAQSRAASFQLFRLMQQNMAFVRAGSFNYQVGDSLVITCDNGYILIGPSTVTCQQGGTWSSTPSCVRRGNNG